MVVVSKQHSWRSWLLLLIIIMSFLVKYTISPCLLTANFKRIEVKFEGVRSNFHFLIDLQWMTKRPWHYTRTTEPICILLEVINEDDSSLQLFYLYPRLDTSNQISVKFASRQRYSFWPLWIGSNTQQELCGSVTPRDVWYSFSYSYVWFRLYILAFIFRSIQIEVNLLSNFIYYELNQIFIFQLEK